MTDRDPSVVTTPKVIAIAVVECNGQFLVGVRPEGRALAGYWEFPGGKCRRGESPADAAVRECLEETGIDVVLRQLLTRTQHQYDYGLLDLYFYAATPPSGRSTPRPPFRWVPRAELATLQFPPANAAVLAMLRDWCDASLTTGSQLEGGGTARFAAPLDINSRPS